MQNLRFLLLQIRDADDPIRPQEVGCFVRAIGCEEQAVIPLDLLSGFPTDAQLQKVDAVLIGGSGNYSAAGQSPWLDSTLAGFRRLVELRKPTFASCWGFQAIARAMGGRCIHDPPHAELGTLEFQLTPAGLYDPLFGGLPDPFLGLAGHEDHVVELPPGAVLLASSPLVKHQAFRLADMPIYCTQFHPELDLKAFLERVAQYPQYVKRIAGATLEQFARSCREAPDTPQLLRRFAQLVIANSSS
ncbi:MAG: type 1 glutamine amidotransferase [Planctomycetales bacterium]|nr:type 1 glutamine amidotransferase [Planctomycetales bacterium]